MMVLPKRESCGVRHNLIEGDLGLGETESLAAWGTRLRQTGPTGWSPGISRYPRGPRRPLAFYELIS